MWALEVSRWESGEGLLRVCVVPDRKEGKVWSLGLFVGLFFFLFTPGREHSARDYSFLVCFTFWPYLFVGFKNICLIPLLAFEDRTCRPPAAHPGSDVSTAIWATITTPILYMRKPRHRKIKYLVQGHPASKWERWDLNPGSFIQVSVPLHDTA